MLKVTKNFLLIFLNLQFKFIELLVTPDSSTTFFMVSRKSFGMISRLFETFESVWAVKEHPEFTMVINY